MFNNNVISDYLGRIPGTMKGLAAGQRWFQKNRTDQIIPYPSMLYGLQLCRVGPFYFFSALCNSADAPMCIHCQIMPFMLQGSTTPKISWTVLGVGVRCAQDRDIDRRAREMTSKPTIRLQLWIRAFWGASRRRSRHEHVHRKTEDNVVRQVRLYLSFSFGSF